MTLTILDDSIGGDRTGHTARLAPGGEHMWEVSWLPGRRLDGSVMTAMTLADLTGPGDMYAGHRLWLYIEGSAAGLDLTASDVLTRTANPPAGAQAGKSAPPADPKATG